MKSVAKVLLIDDNPSCNFIMEEFIKLVDNSIQVTSVEGMSEAMSILKAQRNEFPDVIFVDINMPVHDGFAFLDEYEAEFVGEFPSTRIYMLSSSLRPEDRERSLLYKSVHDFLSKDDIDETLKKSLYPINE